jgi:hypothetical protein
MNNWVAKPREFIKSNTVYSSIVFEGARETHGPAVQQQAPDGTAPRGQAGKIMGMKRREKNEALWLLCCGLQWQELEESCWDKF